ncbi:hypothetical protein D3C86_1127590 [compost metagenome]
MGVDRTDVLAAAFGLDEAFHHFLALGAGEVTRLRACDLDVLVRGNGFFEALLAVDGGRRAGRALQFHHLAILGADVLDQPVAGNLAFMNLIGGYGGQVKIVRSLDLAVEQDDRDFFFLGFLQHGIPSGRDDRRDQDRIDALRDEAANGLDLVFLLLLRVGEFKRDAALFGLLLGDGGFSRAPAGFRTDLREADGKRFGGNT